MTPEAGYALGRATACVVPVAVTVRCVPVAVDQTAVYDEIDSMLETVYRVPGLVIVQATVGAHDLAGQTLVVGEIDVQSNVTTPQPVRRAHARNRDRGHRRHRAFR